MTKLKSTKIQQHWLNTNTSRPIKNKGINSTNKDLTKPNKDPIKINLDSKQIKIDPKCINLIST
jgi:hypothetical protein